MNFIYFYDNKITSNPACFYKQTSVYSPKNNAISYDYLEVE